MYEAVGRLSKKVYATGTRADCMRTLNEKYPYQRKKHSVVIETISESRVLPEEIQVRRVRVNG